MPSAVKIVLAVTLLGNLLVVLRLGLSGLYKRYPAFTAFLAFRVVDEIPPLFVNQRSDAYAYLWIAMEPTLRIFCIFAVLEMYRLMLEQYKGVYTAGRWALYGASLISVIVSVLMLLARITPSLPQNTIYLGYGWAFIRGVDFSLTIFILLSLAFVSWCRIGLSRNLVVHATIYSVYFLSSGTYALVRKAIWNLSAPRLDLVFSSIVAGCTFAWFFLLSPKGEQAKVTRSGLAPHYEARLLEKLEALNQMMLKSAKS
jgi:hypothetical protein